jgi:hypothetical protein
MLTWFRRKTTRPDVFWLNAEECLPHEAFWEGTFISGATGAGKTSCSGRKLKRYFLSKGYGLLQLCAKPEDAEDLMRDCQVTGRMGDFKHFREGGEYQTNPIQWEATRGKGGGFAENIDQLISQLSEVIDRGKSTAGGNEPFWQIAARQERIHLIDLLRVGVGKVTIPNMNKMLVLAPTSIEQAQSDSWKASSLFWKIVEEGKERKLSPRDAYDFERAVDYFCFERAGQAEKTRASITAHTTSAIAPFDRGAMRELFSEGLNLRPEEVRDGAVICCDVPIKLYHLAGQLANVAWKLMFMRAVEQTQGRPVCLWADEAHLFTTSYDQIFTSTARSSKCATVYLTQNIANLLDAVGHHNKAAVESLLGNLQVKIAHQQGEVETNRFHAELIGKKRTRHYSFNGAIEPPELFEWMPRQHQRFSAGYSEAIDFELEPQVFSQLQKPSRANGGVSTAVVYGGGKTFSNGRSWTLGEFPWQ